MIDIKPLASGSKGNCYYITDGSSGLLIEAGIPIKEIKQGLNYRLSEIEGCLVSHEHQDHCKSVEDIMAAGIDCYMSKGTADELNLDYSNHRLHGFMKISPTININSFKIKAFEIQHDAADPLGFILWSKETKDKLVYITDSFYSKYTFHEVNYYLIECNYAEDILNDNIKSGRVPAAQKNRIIKSHMSLETVKEMLRANDLSKVKEIWLLHLSDRNSHAERFKREVQEIAGCPVYIAGGGEDG